NRRLLKPTSRRKLVLELRQKRISDEIISAVMDSEPADEREVLKELIAKKSGQTRYQDKQKLMQYLARQGFNYSDIKSALSEEPL
ncbi:MAG TPA: RecX family transcriptional regulator, partial [Candidatus Saccharimonadales bacterium]|nr:RecX family transcriptional regulator [Candidatus Saccharimonadales bacterium]